MSKQDRDELRTMLANVDKFADLMKKKLRKKAAEGYAGGLDPINRDVVVRSIADHVYALTGRCTACGHQHEHDIEEARRQAVDVANLAMMLWAMPVVCADRA